jgi:hypothetical protein
MPQTFEPRILIADDERVADTLAAIGNPSGLQDSAFLGQAATAKEKHLCAHHKMPIPLQPKTKH